MPYSLGFGLFFLLIPRSRKALTVLNKQNR
jgi:hypothetical protein